jgi:serine kinase of HPr protein (carbohydrate metabolism regulator)
VLIQGPSGSGKSRLALALLQAGADGRLPFARLVGDDRVHIEAVNSRLLVRPAPTLAGLIEVRGLGIRRVMFEPLAKIEFVVELGSKEADRLPNKALLAVELEGITLPRLAVAAGHNPLPLVLAYLQTAAAPL